MLISSINLIKAREDNHYTSYTNTLEVRTPAIHTSCGVNGSERQVDLNSHEVLTAKFLKWVKWVKWVKFSASNSS